MIYTAPRFLLVDINSSKGQRNVDARYLCPSPTCDEEIPNERSESLYRVDAGRTDEESRDSAHFDDSYEPMNDDIEK